MILCSMFQIPFPFIGSFLKFWVFNVIIRPEGSAMLFLHLCLVELINSPQMLLCSMFQIPLSFIGSFPKCWVFTVIIRPEANRRRKQFSIWWCSTSLQYRVHVRYSCTIAWLFQNIINYFFVMNFVGGYKKANIGVWYRACISMANSPKHKQNGCWKVLKPVSLEFCQHCLEDSF